MEICSLCNRSFKNKNSLKSHKSRFHREKDIPTYSYQEKSVEPHPAFGYDVNHLSQIKQSTNKRYRSDDEMSDKSEIETERYTKKARSVDESSRSNEDNEGTKRTDKTLEIPVKRLESEMKQVLVVFGMIRDDVDDLDHRLQIVEKQKIDSKQLKYIELLPKAFDIINKNKKDIDGLEEDIDDLEEATKTPRQVGAGQDPREIKEISRNVKHLFKELDIVKDFVNKVPRQIDVGQDQNKIKELSGNVRQIFKDLSIVKGFITNKYISMANTERMYKDTLHISSLFREGKHNDIRYNIKKLRNAAIMVSKGRLVDLTEKEQELLEELFEASLFDATDLFDQNYELLKKIFTSIPSYELIRDLIKEAKKEQEGKTFKEWLDEETPEQNVESESENNGSGEYQHMTEEVENSDETEEADKTVDEEWNVDNVSENDESEEYQSMIEEVENTDVDEKEEEAEETSDEDLNVDNGSDKSEDYQSVTED